MDWEKARAVARYLYVMNGMTFDVLDDNRRPQCDNYMIYVSRPNYGVDSGLSAGGVGYTGDEAWLEALRRIAKWLGKTEDELKIIADFIG